VRDEETGTVRCTVVRSFPSVAPFYPLSVQPHVFGLCRGHALWCLVLESCITRDSVPPLCSTPLLPHNLLLAVYWALRLCAVLLSRNCLCRIASEMMVLMPFLMNCAHTACPVPIPTMPTTLRTALATATNTIPHHHHHPCHLYHCYCHRLIHWIMVRRRVGARHLPTRKPRRTRLPRVRGT
jgi:hypothetical protein